MFCLLTGYHEKRTQAVLTLAEYRQLVIMAALQANRRIRSVSPPGLGFPVPKTPLGIWKRAEQMGKVNLCDPGDLNKLRKLLLPQVKCTVSRKGLLAEGIRYGCEDAREAGLFDRQPQEGRPHGGVLFHDPADVSVAWYCPDPEATPEISWPCRLAPESQFLKGLCWTEAQKMLTLEKTAVANEREESLERVTELTAKQQDIIKAAKARKEPRTESNAKVLAAMRKNRQDERILNEKATRRMEPAKDNLEKEKQPKEEDDEILFNSMGYPQRVEDIPD